LLAREQADQTLPTNEVQLRLALDVAQLATWDWDIILDQFVFGGYHQQQFALPTPSSTTTLQGFLERAHPSDRSRIAETIARSRQEGSSWSEEFRIVGPDGRVRWLAAQGAVCRDAAGRAVRMIGVAADITERRQTQQELRDSEERYRQLFESSPHPMLLFDPATSRFLAVNEAAVAHYGYPRDEFLQMSVADLVIAEDRAALQAELKDLPRPGEVGIWRHRKKDGAISHVETRGHFVHLDGRRVRFVLIHDINERLRIEEALRASEAKYRSLIDNLDLQIFLKDRRGRYLAANKRFCQALGLSEAEVIGQTDFDLLPPALAVKHQAEDLRVWLHGQRIESEGQVHVAGRDVTVRLTRIPIKEEDGTISGVLGMGWDVTEQRALEGQLRQAQKMEGIGMLAGGVAHDFNNLLTVIAGNIALAMGTLPENHPSRDLLLTAEQASVQANELTNRLLSFSRQTILRPVPTPLVTCMDETVSILRRTVDPRIVLERQAPDDLWLVEGDPAQINQVLLNLCLNARDAMPQGGRLLLEAANVVISDDYARQHVEARAGEFVRLSISDTGHGISPEIRARIFEPFFTTKAPGKGTGLGLAMVFGIVKQHHGWIEFSTEVNRGTRFDIFLPRYQPAGSPQTPAPVPLRSPPRGGTETILLADDEPMIRQLGRTILERYGYHVLLADDGLEAVEIYERARDRIALVILDLTMPRLSGHDALQHLLQIDPAVKVLLTSGYSPEHLDQSYHEHVLGFISKPFRPEQLADIVRGVLDRP
jgi:PAS domain S-box-containing protein